MNIASVVQPTCELNSKKIVGLIPVPGHFCVDFVWSPCGFLHVLQLPSIVHVLQVNWILI